MSYSMSGIEVLIEYGVNVAEYIAGELSEEVDYELRSVLKNFVTEKIGFQEACQKVTGLVGKDDSIVRINEILSLPDEPIQYNEEDGDSSSSVRKKTRTWTISEDQRLIAGVFHYGLENWQAVAQYLGSGRNRSQCSQRWARCLNPKISKKSWSGEEDKKLESLVRIHGEKSWTKISSLMGNRSDVQCRYRYRQILQGSNGWKNSSVEDANRLPLSKHTPLTMSSDSILLGHSVIMPRIVQPQQTIEEPAEERISLSGSSQLTGSMPVFNLRLPTYTEVPVIGMIPANPYIKNITYAPIGIEPRNSIQRLPPCLPRIPNRIPQPYQNESHNPISQPSDSLDSFLSHFK